MAHPEGVYLWVREDTSDHKVVAPGRALPSGMKVLVKEARTGTEAKEVLARWLTAQAMPKGQIAELLRTDVLLYGHLMQALDRVSIVQPEDGE